MKHGAAAESRQFGFAPKSLPGGERKASLSLSKDRKVERTRQPTLKALSNKNLKSASASDGQSVHRKTEALGGQPTLPDASSKRRRASSSARRRRPSTSTPETAANDRLELETNGEERQPTLWFALCIGGCTYLVAVACFWSFYQSLNGFS